MSEELTENNKRTFKAINWLKERHETNDLLHLLKDVPENEIKMFLEVGKFIEMMEKLE